MTAARRAGVACARGEWVMFVDADDTIEPDALGMLMARATPDTDMVISDSRIDGDITPDTCRRSILSTGLFPTGPVGKLIRRSLFGSSHVLDIPREIVRGEDMLMLLRLSYEAKGRIRLLKDSFYNYRMNDAQVTRTFATSSAFEQMFYAQLLRSFPASDIARYTTALIENRISAVELILLGLRRTADTGFRRSAWYRTLQADIKAAGYRRTLWQWTVMNLAGPHTIRPLRLIKEKLFG
ncbi:MAG: glycosyltransferase [Muribaculaceae bacterium]|nr:glycosyltransferase [Muribaculaceae bacterium]